MTKRTTDQWEALLDGITPAPWVIGATLKDPLVDVSAGTYEDARLAAHARAAVAEVIRLLKAVEAVRDYCRDNAEAAAWLANGSPDSLEPVFSELADTLTRILNGENNE